jgi:hypothetical protein
MNKISYSEHINRQTVRHVLLSDYQVVVEALDKLVKQCVLLTGTTMQFDFALDNAQDALQTEGGGE